MPYEMFNYPITSYYGEIDNVHKVPHSGVDIATPLVTKAQALFEGTVCNILYNDPILGNAVYLQSDSGERLIYGHLSEIMVRKGQVVSEGYVIGLTGNSGRSTGPHLHLALLDEGGNPLNINPDISSGISIVDRIGNIIGEKINEIASDFGIFLLDLIKVIIICNLIWACYCIMIKKTRFGLPPFSDSPPYDALFLNCMFFAILSLAQGVLLQ
jgi:hypothetical protein